MEDHILKSEQKTWNLFFNTQLDIKTISNSSLIFLRLLEHFVEFIHNSHMYADSINTWSNQSFIHLFCVYSEPKEIAW